MDTAEGFSSRDQVRRWRGLPEGQRIVKNIYDKLPFGAFYFGIPVVARAQVQGTAAHSLIDADLEDGAKLPALEPALGENRAPKRTAKGCLKE